LLVTAGKKPNLLAPAWSLDTQPLNKTIGHPEFAREIDKKAAQSCPLAGGQIDVFTDRPDRDDTALFTVFRAKGYTPANCVNRVASADRFSVNLYRTGPRLSCAEN
jgi:hypothetical protein